MKRIKASNYSKYDRRKEIKNSQIFVCHNFQVLSYQHNDRQETIRSELI